VKGYTLTSWLLLPLLCVGLAACDGEDPVDTSVTYDLTFTGDDTFHGAHGDQTIHVGIREGSGTLVASETGTVSPSAEPAFSFTFSNVLEEGEDYDLEYWIDSNFGDDGTQGVCDAPNVDHQWEIDVDPVMDDVAINDTHRPTETEDVCTTGGDGDGGGPGY